MTWPLPDSVLANARARRGRLEVFDSIDPARSALLVIDMQLAWTAPEGPMHIPGARSLVPGINALAAALRARGGLVAWVQHSNAPPGAPLHGETFYATFIRPERREASLRTLAPGAPLHALDPALDLRDGDLRLRKYRFSAFTRNPEDPEALLRARGIDTVVVAGVATNICCESTARDAMMRDFRVFMPHDAVTAGSAEAHGAGLLAVAQVFADIRPVAALLRLLEEP
ncbi:MAG: isochorismatase family protein [Rhodospirillales bacterium]